MENYFFVRKYELTNKYFNKELNKEIEIVKQHDISGSVIFDKRISTELLYETLSIIVQPVVAKMINEGLSLKDVLSEIKDKCSNEILRRGANLEGIKIEHYESESEGLGNSTGYQYKVDSAEWHIENEK